MSRSAATPRRVQSQVCERVGNLSFLVVERIFEELIFSRIREKLLRIEIELADLLRTEVKLFSAQVVGKEICFCLVGFQPVAMQQEVVDLVGEDEFVKLDVLLAEHGC